MLKTASDSNTTTYNPPYCMSRRDWLWWTLRNLKQTATDNADFVA